MGLSSLEELPCSQVSVSVCTRKLQHLHQQQSRLRLLHPQRGSTQYGSEVLFWLHYPHSKVCGSVKRNMMNQGRRLCIASVSRNHFALHNFFAIVTRMSGSNHNHLRLLKRHECCLIVCYMITITSQLNSDFFVGIGR